MGPEVLAGAGMAAQAGGSLLGFMGAKREGAAGQAMYQYQAGIAQLNQKIALQNRDYALGVGETEASQYGMKSRFEAGRIRAAQGASGIDVGSGSSVDVQKGQKLVSDIDMAQIRNNAARKAYGFETEATQDVAQAGLYERAGEDVKAGADIKAMGSLISGVAGVSDKWLQYKSNFGTA